ncbi:MAG: type II secretion system protein [Patescibacteria group bacterium]|nr:type II secretion system protein [Patescibacteria group bacterium]
MFKLIKKNKCNLNKGFTPLETGNFNNFFSLFNLRNFKKDKDGRNKFLTGFTLVEMITAVAIFSMVMVIAMGALLAVLNANKQNQAIQTAVNNLSLAMEMMSREIRVGYTYHCGTTGAITDTRNCSAGETYLALEPFDGNPTDVGDQVVYRLLGNRIQRSDDSGANFLNLTASAVVLQELKFYVSGSSTSDNVQPRVLITVSGYVDLGSIGDRGKSYFNLQTTASQRLIDF